MTRSLPSAAQGAFALTGSDHRSVFRHVRNFLAGQAIGVTRDSALLDELVKALFCKHYLDHHGGAPPTQHADDEIAAAYHGALDKLQDEVPHVFESVGRFLLEPSALAFVHGCISAFDLDSADYDLVGDAFEVFTGSDARGQEGQFFTPQNAVKLLIDLVDPKPGETIIDPACGAGGFLSTAARHLVAHGMASSDAVASVYGVEKDRYLANLARTRLSFLALTLPEVTCADSLAWKGEDGSEPAVAALSGTFDVVLTNPPFGSKIVAATPDVQRRFDLGYQWKRDGARFVKGPRVVRSIPPQVLFIERCLSLVRPGGRVGIVVPESLISGRGYRHVVSWFRERAELHAVVGMPESLFKTSGKGGTHTKTCLVLLEKKDDSGPKGHDGHAVFMAEARWCGNDSRGRRTDRDELPEISSRWAAHRRGELTWSDHLGYNVSLDDLVDDILAPRYYDPEVAAELGALADTHDLVKVGDLIDQGMLRITVGHEVGAAEYGSGVVPFVRTSDISNWEIKVDPKHCVSDAVYEAYAAKQDVREGDLLMVRDGTYLVGTCAYVTKYDTRIVFQSHILKLRLLDTTSISPHLLLAALSSSPVRRQIKAKRFTQDIIDSLGGRVSELILPLPKSPEVRERVESMVRKAIDERVEARELARQAVFELVGRVMDSGDTLDPGLEVQ